MTALLPTRVSLYDFLYEDTLSIDSVFADVGNISIPQARIVIKNGIQAIISGLVTYNQKQGPEAVLKKLFCKSQIKELRKYNAFNFETMTIAYRNGSSINDTLFGSTKIQKQICNMLALKADLTANQVRPLLAALTSLCIREIAILADFARLDIQEINDWFALQPQFFQLQRNESIDSTAPDIKTTTLTADKIPTFDLEWHSITGYKQPSSTNEFNSEQLPHYAKVIGRTKLGNTIPINENGQIIVDDSNNSDILTFGPMTNISLPYQRWLLQLAKISDIYLSRKRLKVAPEPIQPPSRPFVNFVFKDSQYYKSDSTTDVDTESAANAPPLWKNPVIILLILVIGVLGLLAVGKYQYKKSKINTTGFTSNTNQSQIKVI